MPTYQYSCTDCGHFFEQVQSFSEDSLTVCPQCQGRLRKVFNAVGVVFKGSGFYRTDSRADSRTDGRKSERTGEGGETTGGGSGSGEPKSGEKKSGEKKSGQKAGGAGTGAGQTGSGATAKAGAGSSAA